MYAQPVGEKTANLVGEDGIAVVPTTARALHLVQFLLQSRRLMNSGLLVASRGAHANV